jgi:hypothetical protein
LGLANIRSQYPPSAGFFLACLFTYFCGFWAGFDVLENARFKPFFTLPYPAPTLFVLSDPDAF